MDRSVRRLLQDQTLMLEDKMLDKTRDHMRCKHLDKTYDWYTRHGRKEASKEKPHPSFITFDSKESVMPGSLRKDSLTGMPAGWKPAAEASKFGSTNRVTLMTAAASVFK